MFAEDTAWRTPWMDKVLPTIEALCAHRPDRIYFTRFIPARRADDCSGTWRRYWRRWADMTQDRLEPSKIDLVPALARFVPPAQVLDKRVYSPWLGTPLHADFDRAGVDTLVVTGGETDVCVLAAVLGAVDLGYRVVVVTDALCSGSDTITIACWPCTTTDTVNRSKPPCVPRYAKPGHRRHPGRPAHRSKASPPPLMSFRIKTQIEFEGFYSVKNGSAQDKSDFTIQCRALHHHPKTAEKRRRTSWRPTNTS
ncbi:cysteine hydrolase family protein [Brevundimonas nasdae]|uniref:cysteine hydrolase family protein n=1 Tax=Brevundimonas nasdae TaxID=172043 RepID=UPI001FD1E949|nr:isochorismatase family cysteine hydrolase [Brevundimonas nasdae]